ncbi:MAG: adenosylcobinamide-GDP ribazoletransferase [Elusimicrobia bacterium]|nr:adenosylcobinamide-GDP ribazoletransferase [Elusimicrobiota bacterium]
MAIQFLTILPMKGDTTIEKEDCARSMAFYPLAGLLIGFFTLLSYQIASKMFTGGVSLVIAFVLGILLTGGLHLDGFADVCDGFYGGKNREEILTVLKDPHIGTMAVLGLFSLLLLKLALYFSLFLKGRVMESFLLVPAVSRGMMTVIASLYPYAREDGTAKPFLAHISWREPAFASVFILTIAYVLLGVRGCAIAAVTFFVLFGFTQWVKKKIGGITGDVLGSVNEISEVTVLFFLNMVYFSMNKEWIL